MHQKKYSLDLKPPSKYIQSVSMKIPLNQKSKSYIITNDANKIGATKVS